MASALRKLFDVKFAYQSQPSCFQLKLQRTSGRSNSSQIQQKNQQVNSMAEKTKQDKKQGMDNIKNIHFQELLNRELRVN